MALPIYVIGSSNTDMVVQSERLPLPGETLMAGTFFMNPGGKGANQAVAAARLGGRVTFIANVGADIFGTQAISQFKLENINVDFITIDPALPSGVALINVDAAGENCIVVASGANAGVTIEKVKTALDSIIEPGILVLQQEIPMETVSFVIREASARNHKVILNPAPANAPDEGVFQFLYAITPNETEAGLLTGIQVIDEYSARLACSILHDKGVQNVVITLGAKGVLVSDGVSQKMIAAPKVTAVDTTAAGDCFTGALAVSLSDGRSLDDAASFACSAASISVTRMGAQASMPTLDELRSFQSS